jgi:replication-associated recombination protein RarA
MSKQFLTKSGYDFFELSSAFQKAIRRGDEDLALRCAAGYWASGHIKYVWKRLLVIVSEDVGLAEPNAPQIIWSLYQKYLFWVENGGTGKLEYYHAVSYLARCKKSRYIDLIIAKYEYLHETEPKSIEIPDYAYDMHTRKGLKMGRGMEHFYTDGMVLANANKVDKEEQLEKECKFYDAELVKIRKMQKKQEEEKQKNIPKQSNLF